METIIFDQSPLAEYLQGARQTNLTIDEVLLKRSPFQIPIPLTLGSAPTLAPQRTDTATANNTSSLSTDADAYNSDEWSPTRAAGTLSSSSSASSDGVASSVASESDSHAGANDVGFDSPGRGDSSNLTRRTSSTFYRNFSRNTPSILPINKSSNPHDLGSSYHHLDINSSAGTDGTDGTVTPCRPLSVMSSSRAPSRRSSQSPSFSFAPSGRPTVRSRFRNSTISQRLHVDIPMGAESVAGDSVLAQSTASGGDGIRSAYPRGGGPPGARSSKSAVSSRRMSLIAFKEKCSVSFVVCFGFLFPCFALGW